MASFLSPRIAFGLLVNFEISSSILAIKNITKSHEIFAKRINSIEIIKDIRQTGTILAIELKSDSSGYTSSMRQKLYQDFIDQGVLLRPLGNVIYILPPYCIKEKELKKVYNAIENQLKKMR